MRIVNEYRQRQLSLLPALLQLVKLLLLYSVAKYFQTEIISADSRQCFKELKIGVARPSEEELRKVPHHFIASHSIEENINAAYFEQYALQKANELFQTT